MQRACDPAALGLFRALFASLREGYMTVWVKRGKGSRTYWLDLSAKDALTQAAKVAQRADAEGYDVYFSTCPGRERRSDRQRIRNQDALCIVAFVMDIDTQEDPAKAGKRVAADVPEAERALEALSLPPSATVHSGHGIHGYWLLDAPARIDDAEGFARIDRIRRAFVKAVAGVTGWADMDTGASEPSRVLRVPGTHNYKHTPALPVEVGTLTERRYSLEALAAFAGTSTAEEREEPREAVAPAPSVDAPAVKTPVSASEYQPGGKYYLSDAQIWDRLGRIQGMTKLLNGDVSDFSGDESAADMRLCDALAFFTGGDMERMDGLFRQTLLMRTKWDERHGAQTYGQMTLHKACTDTRTFYRGRDYLLDKLPGGDKERIEAVAQAYDRASGGMYLIDGLRTCAAKHNKDGEPSLEPLADFVAVPVETILRDDGVEQWREYIFEGFDYRGTRLPRVAVPASKLRAFQWVTESWPGAVIEAGQTKADKLRVAIQKAERELALRRTVYAHTGWRQIGGKWAFLFEGGAVGASGVCVELPGKLSRYALPEAGGVSASEGARASLALLGLAPLRASVPLLAAMFLAPLCEFFSLAGERVSTMLTVRGKTQSKKSVLTSLFLNHFGTEFTYTTLPLNFQSTPNAICGQLFQLKDVPAVVDDFHPTASERRTASLDEMTRTARRISRAIGDDAGRARMESDGRGIQADRPARGLVIITAEFEPDLGESGDSRCFVIPIEPGDVPAGAALDNAQEAARQGVYASTMRAYLTWVAQRADGGAQAFAEKLRHAFQAHRRALYAQAVELANYGRMATAGAHLLTAWDVMLSFFQEVGAVDEGQAGELCAQGRAAILEDIRAHARGVRNTDPLILFARGLLEAAETYGALPEAARYVEQGGNKEYIGLRTPEAFYVHPTRALGRVAELLQKAGTPFPISARELWRRLYQAGVASTEGAKPQHVPGAGTLYVVKLGRQAVEALRDGNP